MPLYGRFRGFFVFCVCVRLAAPPPLCGLVSVKKRRPPPTHPHLKIVDNSRLRPAPKVAVSRVFQGFSRRLPSHPALSRISQISCLPTKARFSKPMLFTQICRISINNDCANQINSLHLGNVSDHICITHQGAAMNAIQVRLHSRTVAIIITPLPRIDAASTQCPPELFVLRIIKRKPEQKCLDLLRACFAHSLHRTIAVFVDGLFVVTVWALLSFRLHRHDHCLSFVSALVVEFSYF